MMSVKLGGRSSLSRNILLFGLVVLFTAVSLQLGITNAAPATETATAPPYADVNRDGWVFYSNSATPTSVIAVKSGEAKQAIFTDLNVAQTGARELKQRPDYYNSNSNQPANCKPAYIVFDGATQTGTEFGAYLYEDQAKNGCGDSGSNFRDTHGRVGIRIAIGIPPDIKEIDQLSNSGKVPLGCPGYPDIPASIVGGERAAINYNCPGGEYSIQNGDRVATVIDRETTSSSVGTGAPVNEDVCVGKLSWILCPVIDVTFKTLEALESLINNLLFVDTNPIFNTTSTDQGEAKSSTAYYKAWAGFRTIALGLIVIAALVIVIASAFGFEILDAYTIRKAMPRLFIAVIAIALSWELMEFVITLSNDIGMGIRSLIYAPFVESGYTMIEFNTAENTIIAALILGGVGVFGLLGLFTFALTGMLGLIIAFLALVFREILIVTLVILAPLGIAAFILPGTQKAYKLWENSLQVMLIAFPIISGMIAAGHVIAMVAYDGGEANILNTFIAYIAFIIPYFMMPMAFRWAGGVMATIGGIGNDKSRGAFDRLSKYRQGASAKNLHNMKTGNRWKEGGAVQKYMGVNRMKRGLNFATSEGTIMAASPGKRREARDLRRRMEAENISKDPRFNAMKEDDSATRAMTYQNGVEARSAVYEHLNRQGKINGRTVSDYGGTANFQAAARAEAERAANVVESSVGYGRPQAILAAQQLATTGTGYRDLDDQAETIARVSNGNNSTAAQIAGYNNFVNKQKGRHDLAPGAGNLISLAHGKMDNLKKGIPSGNESRAQLQNAWNSGSLYQWGNGKSKAMQNIADHHLTNLESNDVREREDAAIALMEMQSMLPSASGENQKIIKSALRAANIDYEDTAMSMDEQISRRAQYGSDFRTNGTGAAAGDFHAEALRRKARVYDQQSQLNNTQHGGS